MELLDRLRERKANSIRVACTHGLFSSGALRIHNGESVSALFEPR